jgi:YidC/Oxa1 family membrane protein insertase
MFQAILTQPLYNGFIYLISIIPGGDVGFAIIALTFIIRFLFYPVFASQIRTTMGMQAMQGELDEIKAQYKDDKEEQNKQALGLYKKYKVNPLSLILSLFIQIPIFIALYYTFFHTKLPEINVSLLYSFVHAPALVNVRFLGILDLTLANNIFVVAIVGILQFLVMYLTLGRTKKHAPKNLSEEKLMAQKMQQNVSLYMLPVIIAMVSYSTPAAVGLYFAAGSIVSIGQEWLIRRELAKKAAN